jgi:predicted  nucleic acid-binding Zn-ribbon protein
MSDSEPDDEPIQSLILRLKMVEHRLKELEGLQKQDADEAVGCISDLNEAVEAIEQNIEKLEDQVEHHKHLFDRYKISDLFDKLH